MSKNQQWLPSKYQHNANFVSELGLPLVELLNPQAGEKILDLGCGDGTLMMKLQQLGCEVKGVDSSSDMITAAQNLGLSAQVMDGEKLTFTNEFDAVFSNAALHWMVNPDAVIAGVYTAIKDKGRFVAELGGIGNVETVVNAIDICLEKRGINFKSLNPWYFPSVEDYQTRLEKGGFTVQEITLFERPTKLPQGIQGWLEMFAQQFTNHLPENDRPLFIQEVTDICKPKLCDRDGIWWADYVRLRFLATK